MLERAGAVFIAYLNPKPSIPNCTDAGPIFRQACGEFGGLGLGSRGLLLGPLEPWT